MAFAQLPPEVFMTGIQPYLSSVDLRNLVTAVPSAKPKVDWVAEKARNELVLNQWIRLVYKSAWNRWTGALVDEDAYTFQRLTGIKVLIDPADPADPESVDVPYIPRTVLVEYLKNYQTHYRKLLIKLPMSGSMTDILIEGNSDVPSRAHDITLEAVFPAPGAKLYDIVTRVQRVDLPNEYGLGYKSIHITSIDATDTTVTVIARRHY